MKLRPYQIELSEKGADKMRKFGLVYYALEVRTGKTLISLETCKLLKVKSVLFITKKLAFKSIKDDYNNFNYNDNFEITIINKESVHTINKNFDIVILDEAHEYGAYPKMGKYAKFIKEKYLSIPKIFLSGTPYPESFSQIYNQLSLYKYNPFSEYPSFYKWAKDYVIVEKKQLGFAIINDYSKAIKDKVLQDISSIMLSFTQQEAGFNSSVNIKILECDMLDKTKDLIKQLTKKRFIQGKNDTIIADTSVKLMSKVHQLSSGTIKTDNKNYLVLDDSKAKFIQEIFKGKKIAIFYYFKAELEAIKQVFRQSITTDLEEFKTTNKHFAVQQSRGAKGISLKEADVLVFYNFGFSNEKFVQSIDRLTTIDRSVNDVYFIFNRIGIEKKIYESIQEKKDYILSAFKKDYGI